CAPRANPGATRIATSLPRSSGSRTSDVAAGCSRVAWATASAPSGYNIDIIKTAASGYRRPAHRDFPRSSVGGIHERGALERSKFRTRRSAVRTGDISRPSDLGDARREHGESRTDESTTHTSVRGDQW